MKFGVGELVGWCVEIIWRWGRFWVVVWGRMSLKDGTVAVQYRSRVEYSTVL